MAAAGAAIFLMSADDLAAEVELERDEVEACRMSCRQGEEVDGRGAARRNERASMIEVPT